MMHHLERLRAVLQRALFLLGELARCTWLLPALAILFGVVLAVDEAWGRPGGGQTYSGRSSGGGRSYSGGGRGHSGGGDGGDVAGLVIWLLFHHPKVGIPIVLIVVFLIIQGQRKQRQHAGWSTGLPSMRPPRASPRVRLESLRGKDPDFSVILFEDFLYALFARAHEARGRQDLSQVAAWISAPAKKSLLDRSTGLKSVHSVVIGSMGLSDVHLSPDRVEVSALFEANYTEESNAPSTFYVKERWQLFRRPEAKSRPPDQITVFSCPSCGAATPELRDSVCSFCHNRVDTGQFDWVVQSITLLAKEPRGPQLTGETAEQGTYLPTIAAPDLPAKLAGLTASDAGFSLPALKQRVELIHKELNRAWSAREWKIARPYVTDQLFQMQLYWIETYRRAGLTNVTEKVRMLRVEPAQLTSDRWLDAFTLRIFATGLDYTLRDSDQKLVSGSRSRDRAYSEYWTLIRSRTTHRPATTSPNCPQCGAALEVSMAGQCAYCEAKITSGDFDWVLSRIEQDEAYTG